jgi:rRNA maturation endonuclease Nob1
METLVCEMCLTLYENENRIVCRRCGHETLFTIEQAQNEWGMSDSEKDDWLAGYL